MSGQYEVAANVGRKRDGDVEFVFNKGKVKGANANFAALNQPKDLRNVKENARRKRGRIKLQET